MSTSKLNVRVRAILCDEYGNEKELFDSSFTSELFELKEEAKRISPELREKILKYLEEIKI